MKLFFENWLLKFHKFYLKTNSSEQKFSMFRNLENCSAASVMILRIYCILQVWYCGYSDGFNNLLLFG